MTNKQCIKDLIIDAERSKRGYADEFCWPDRDIEEWGVISYAFRKALKDQNALFFGDVILRGRGNDPPDCESLNHSGERVAFEVTELVHGDSIAKAKAEREKKQTISPFEWSVATFREL